MRIGLGLLCILLFTFLTGCTQITNDQIVSTTTNKTVFENNDVVKFNYGYYSLIDKKFNEVDYYNDLSSFLPNEVDLLFKEAELYHYTITYNIDLNNLNQYVRPIILNGNIEIDTGNVLYKYNNIIFDFTENNIFNNIKKIEIDQTHYILIEFYDNNFLKFNQVDKTDIIKEKITYINLELHPEYKIVSESGQWDAELSFSNDILSVKLNDERFDDIVYKVSKPTRLGYHHDNVSIVNYEEVSFNASFQDFGEIIINTYTKDSYLTLERFYIDFDNEIKKNYSFLDNVIYYTFSWSNDGLYLNYHIEIVDKSINNKGIVIEIDQTVKN